MTRLAELSNIELASQCISNQNPIVVELATRLIQLEEKPVQAWSPLTDHDGSWMVQDDETRETVCTGLNESQAFALATYHNNVCG